MSYAFDTLLTIPNGAAVSNAFDFGGSELTRITAPAAWTAADLVLEFSGDGTAWNSLYDFAGNAIKLTGFTAGRTYDLSSSSVEVENITFFRVRSSTGGADVNQAADRVVTVTYEPDE